MSFLYRNPSSWGGSVAFLLDHNSFILTAGLHVPAPTDADIAGYVYAGIPVPNPRIVDGALYCDLVRWEYVPPFQLNWAPYNVQIVGVIFYGGQAVPRPLLFRDDFAPFQPNGERAIWDPGGQPIADFVR